MLRNPAILPILACPQTGAPLRLADDGRALASEAGTSYPVVDGIPVLLAPQGRRTHAYFDRTLEVVAGRRRIAFSAARRTDSTVDPFVQQEIVKTCGNLYHNSLHKLPRYPIPNIPLPRAANKLLVDVGCNWGRWSFAAARQGYRVVGVDPSIDAVAAAYRVAADLGVAADFVVADARFLPFKAAAVDRVFSYSVLQHLTRADCDAALQAVHGALAPGGCSLIQMANRRGPRQTMNRWRGLGDTDREFAVQTYTVRTLRDWFTQAIGPTRVFPDGYLSLNAQPSDLDLMSPTGKAVVALSQTAKRVQRVLPGLVELADSVYLDSTKAA